jgi:hypothetical protein
LAETGTDEHALSGADAVQALLQPRDDLPPGVDAALFGQSLAELGLRPDQLVVGNVQWRAIVRVYQSMERAIEQGRIQDFQAAITYMLNAVGDTIPIVLAQALQAFEAELVEVDRDIKDSGWFARGEQKLRKRKDKARKRKLLADIKQVAEMSAQIEAARDSLQGKLTEACTLNPEFVAIKGLQENLRQVHISVSNLLAELGYVQRGYLTRTIHPPNRDGGNDYFKHDRDTQVYTLDYGLGRETFRHDTVQLSSVITESNSRILGGIRSILSIGGSTSDRVRQAILGNLDEDGVVELLDSKDKAILVAQNTPFVIALLAYYQQLAVNIGQLQAELQIMQIEATRARLGQYLSGESS